MLKMQKGRLEITRNLAKIKTLKRRMDDWDMISPFVIPEFVDPFALSSVEDCWGDRKLTGVNLLKSWVSLPCRTALIGNVTPLTMHAPKTSQAWSGLSP